MTIKIIPCERDTELFRQYPRHEKPQPVYVEVDLPRRLLVADVDGEPGDGRLQSVVTGHDRRYTIPILTAKAANELLKQMEPLAQRIIDDWSEHWDGQVHMVVLGEDAQAAEYEIKRLLGLSSEGCDGFRVRDNQGFAPEDLVSVWGIDNGAVNGLEEAEFEITGESTDERLIEIKSEITAGLASISPSKVAVTPGLGAYLRELRDKAAKGDEDD